MPIITLTTDFGQDDFLAGAFKGQLLAAHSSFNPIVDITHNLTAANYPLIAYVCTNSFKHYPANSFHIVLVNLFEKKDSELLIAKHNGQLIACPNNGIITMITQQKPKEVIALRIPENQPKTTLAYTQLLAESLAAMVSGKKIENEVHDFILEEVYPLRCTIGPDWMEAQIIFVDRFSNVIVNVTREEFMQNAKNRSFKIVLRNEVITSIHENYSFVNDGDPVAWFNSAGYLELGLKKGKIARLFALTDYLDDDDRRQLFYHTIKIYFD